MRVYVCVRARSDVGLDYADFDETRLIIFVFVYLFRKKIFFTLKLILSMYVILVRHLKQ